MHQSAIRRATSPMTCFTSALWLCGWSAANAASSPQADVVITSTGSIYTLDAAKPWAEAVAIDDGRYVFIGAAAEAKKYIGAATRVIDIGNRMAMPGINDNHVHPLSGGIQALYECRFAFTATPDDIAKALKQCAAKTPAGTWIQGGQWGSGLFEAYKIGSPRAFLDGISKQHPIFLNDDAGHNGWVNSAALELAKITAKTPDPTGGTIVREADGTPNGLLFETAARLFDDVLPQWTDEQYMNAARKAMQIANAYGITGIKDASAPVEHLKAFHALDQAGALTAHVTTCISTPYGSHKVLLDFAAIEAERKTYGSAHLRADCVKLFLDGVPTPARTAAMLHPYVADKEHGDNYTGGDLHIPAKLLAEDLIELDRRGFTVKMHAAGDRSIRAGLDAIEQARKANGRSGPEHELAHASYIDPTDIPRFAALDAVADLSPILWHPSPLTEAVVSTVGSERGSQFWPARALLDSHARIASGSDWPAAVPDENPWIGVEALVTRADPRGQTPGVLWKEQAITLAEALRIYTLNGARALRREKLTGSIELGKSADLIVLDRNLFKVKIEDVGDTQVRMTFFEGRPVFERR